MAAALAAAAFISCSQSSEKTDSEQSAINRRESIRFSAIQLQTSNRLVGSADDYFRDNDIIYTDSISLVMPDTLPGIDLSSLRDSIIRMAFDTTGTDINHIISDFVSRDAQQFSYPTETVEATDINSADGFDLIVGSVINYNPSLLVYEVANSSYMPVAAHGITTRNYINFDLVDGRMLDGAFMFDSAKRKELAGVIAARAREMTEIIGPTEIDSLPDNDNFYISPEGEITFVYQPYEVASYAQGLISISFYPAELADYLTPGAMKYFHLDDLEPALQ